MADPHDAENSDAEIEALLREVANSDNELVAPPAALWDRIEAELAAEFEAPGGATIKELPEQATVVDLSERRARRSLAVYGGALVAAALIAVAFVGLRNNNTAEVVATAELAYDAANFDPLGADAMATVSLTKSNGDFEIEIDESMLPAADDEDADLELWLIEPTAEGEVAGLVSLGVVDRDNPGSYPVPANYDPSVFYVVDISIEPHDGNAEHSGRSILRGALATL